jgi:hypothetical protein
MTHYQPIDLKRYTTETCISTYKIPNVDENIAVLEVTVKTDSDGKITKTATIQKVLTAPGLEILKDCMPTFVKSLFFEDIKTKQPHHLYPEDYQVPLLNNGILSDELSEENLIWSYSGAEMVFKTNGLPISKAIGYYYIGSLFSNQYCYLKPLLKYLKSHPWVLNKNELEIESIPHYNSKKGYDRCISPVCIRTDQETYERIYQTYKNEQNFSRRLKEAICSILFYNAPLKHHDWLGIAPFLKNPPKQLAQDP